MGRHRKISPGDVIEHLEILENLGYRKYSGCNTTYWKCRCTRCGTIVEVPQKNLGKAQKDCGCGRSLPRAEIKPGARFGKLKVVETGKIIPGRGYTYLCECNCEGHKQLYVRGDLLRSGEIRSCGCVHDDTAKKNLKKAHAQNYINGTSVNKILADELQKNNTSGAQGVSWHKKSGKWQARIEYMGKTYQLGYYTDKQEAVTAVETARKHIREDFTEWYSAEYPKKWRKIKKKVSGAEPRRFDELIEKTELYESQIKLLELIEQGKSETDIAREKGCSKQNVNNSLKRIAKKAGYNSWKDVLVAFPPMEVEQYRNWKAKKRSERFQTYDFSKLPERQRLFAELVSKGMNNGQIGRKMGMAKNTVIKWVEYMDEAVYMDENGTLCIPAIERKGKIGTIPMWNDLIDSNIYTDEQLEKLTNRQRQVYELYKEGLLCKDIAERIGVTQSYVSRIMKIVRKKLSN